MADERGQAITGDSNAYFEQAFAAGRLMGIFRGLDPGATVALCIRAWDLGVRVVEVPVQSPAAVPSLRAAVAAARERDMTVGAGSVTTREQVEQVQACGAAFTVAPGLLDAVVNESASRGLPHLPGVATATEVVRARDLGHVWVKAFPASTLTPAWMRAQLAWAPDTQFVATGGVTEANAAHFLAAGCRAVAIGSAFSEPGRMDKLSGLLDQGPG